MDLLTVDADLAIFRILIGVAGLWAVVALFAGKRMPRWTFAMPVATGLFFVYIVVKLITGMKYG